MPIEEAVSKFMAQHSGQSWPADRPARTVCFASLPDIQTRNWKSSLRATRSIFGTSAVCDGTAFRNLKAAQWLRHSTVVTR